MSSNLIEIGSGRARVDAIYEEIRRRICTLGYEPGQTLKEADLAEEFAVSRTPIRQVLQRLQFEQLVESRRGVGTLVTEVDFHALEEVYDLRMHLAELIGQLDPRAPTSEDLRLMRSFLHRCHALDPAGDPRAFAELNLDWHDHLTSFVGNTPLRDTLRLLFHRTARIWLSWGNALDWQLEIDRFEREMGEILAALEEGDLRSVGYAHRNHISMSLIRIRRYAEPARRRP